MAAGTVSRKPRARPATRLARALACLFVFIVSATNARAAQDADTILFNGKIVTLEADAPIVEALAVRDDKIVALGRSADIAALAGPQTIKIDLAGRTVIPGLIDSHIHAIRAGLTFTTEVSWIGTRSLAEALGRIRAAASRAPKGAWLVVAGGWTERQFAEDRPRRRRRSQPPLPAVMSISNCATAARCSAPAASTRSASQRMRRWLPHSRSSATATISRPAG